MLFHFFNVLQEVLKRQILLKSDMLVFQLGGVLDSLEITVEFSKWHKDKNRTAKVLSWNAGSALVLIVLVSVILEEFIVPESLLKSILDFKIFFEGQIFFLFEDFGCNLLISIKEILLTRFDVTAVHNHGRFFGEFLTEFSVSSMVSQTFRELLSIHLFTFVLLKILLDENVW